MNHYYDLLRPFRRSNSLPGSCERPAQTCELPHALDEVEVRRQYSTYENGMKEVVVTTKESTAKESLGEENAVPVSNTPPLVLIPADPSQSVEWFHNYRFIDNCCPPKIAEFAKTLYKKCTTKEPNGSGSNSNNHHNMTTKNNGKKMEAAPKPSIFTSTRDQLFGTRTQVPLERPNPLDSLKSFMEDRKDLDIAVGTRTHGLFGATKKELHQMVTSVLNRVTNDPEKFREVKNELLRLPIPEAKPEQLDKIVNVFFTKAVRERYFSRYYADLISALCKVPRGQRMVGDMTLSLEYRLRQALVKRCQSQFMKDVEEEREICKKKEFTEEEMEIRKERREQMCGTAHFVAELFLQNIIKENVIYYIIASSAAGIETEFSLPPVYTPVEAQMDVIITTVECVKEKFFVFTEDGKRLLPPLIECLRYWQDHFPVSRIRFLLMSLVEKLVEMDRLVHPAPPTVDPLPPSSVEPALTDPSQRRPHPTSTAPRSVQNSSGNSGVSTPALGSGAHGAGTPGSEYLLDNSFLLVPPKTPVQPGNVAKLMNALRLSQVTPGELAASIRAEYGNPVPILPIWFFRCLSVLREENTRKRTGEFLEALIATAAPKETYALRSFIREIALQSLVQTVDQKLQEDFQVFLFWAQLILSDTHRCVLDEEMLNAGLELLLECYSGDVHKYLVEVGEYYASVLTAPEGFVVSNESSSFVRYRPLLRIHSKHDENPQIEMEQLNHADVKEVSLEAKLFVTLMTATPPNYEEELFEWIRTSPRLSKDPTMAAEILSAALTAEICNPNHEYLGHCIPLLQMAVDGADRSDRETILLAELYAVLSITPQPLVMSVSSRVATRLVNSEVLSHETVDRINTFFSKKTTENDQLSIEQRPPTKEKGPSSGSSVTSGTAGGPPRAPKRNRPSNPTKHYNKRRNSQTHPNKGNSPSLSRSINSSVSNDHSGNYSTGGTRRSNESNYTYNSPTHQEIAEEYRNRYISQARSNAAAAGGGGESGKGSSAGRPKSGSGTYGSGRGSGGGRNFRN